MWKKLDHTYSMQTYFPRSCLNVNFVVNNLQVLKMTKIKWRKVKVKTIFWKTKKNKNRKSTLSRSFQIILTIIIRKKSWILQFYTTLKYNTKKESKKLFLTFFKIFNLMRFMSKLTLPRKNHCFLINWILEMSLW